MIRRLPNGFTLIELIVVITIIGILSLVALSRYVNVKEDAEIASFDALGASLLSAAEMAHMRQKIQGIGPNQPITVNGVSITMVNGYPADSSIGLLVEQTDFTYQPSTGWFIWTRAGVNNCRHDYNFAGWAGNPTPDKPNILVTRSGC